MRSWFVSQEGSSSRPLPQSVSTYLQAVQGSRCVRNLSVCLTLHVSPTSTSSETCSRRSCSLPWRPFLGIPATGSVCHQCPFGALRACPRPVLAHTGALRFCSNSSSNVSLSLLGFILVLKFDSQEQSLSTFIFSGSCARLV